VWALWRQLLQPAAARCCVRTFSPRSARTISGAGSAAATTEGAAAARRSGRAGAHARTRASPATPALCLLLSAPRARSGVAMAGE
jgi:hypothetical protein